MNPKQGAFVHTRQEAIRAWIQCVVWLVWSVALVWYGWGFWQLLMGARSTTLDDFAFNWTSSGWLGALAAIFAIRYATGSFRQLFGVALPYLVKSYFNDSKSKKGRRHAG
ncbi:MAG: hypothetical protein AAFQ45_02080 [Pseudomonadota bacterium]